MPQTKETVKKWKHAQRIGRLMTLLKRHGRMCWYCGTKFTSFSEVEIDHIIPTSRGGTEKINNMAIACTMCNRAKVDYTLEEFLYWLRKPKIISPYLIDLSKYTEDQYRKFGDDIDKGLRKPS